MGYVAFRRPLEYMPISNGHPNSGLCRCREVMRHERERFPDLDVVSGVTLGRKGDGHFRLR